MDENEAKKIELERQKLQLEIDKLRFEEKKFDADADMRSAELAKLRAEELKTRLEAQDLRAPYWKKPAFVTALFQGVAVVIAVGSIFYSASLNREISEAKNATAQRDEARLQKVRAEKDRDTAKAELSDATSKLKPAQDELEAKNEQLKDTKANLEQAQTLRDEATKEAMVAPVQEILSSLAKREKGSDATEEKVLREALSTQDAPTNKNRLKYLEDFAHKDSEPTSLRLTALRNLYKRAQEAPPSEGLSAEDFRRQFIALATTTTNGSADTSSWLALLDFLGVQVSSHYICRQYEQVASRMTGYNKARIEMAHFIYQGLFYYDEQCAAAAWDYIDPEGDSENSYSYSGQRLDYPQELLLSRNLASGDPKSVGSFSELTLAVGSNGKRAVWLGLDPAPHEGGPPAGLARYYMPHPDRIKDVENWFSSNKKLVSILNEPGLNRLRTCRPQLLERFLLNYYVGTKELEGYCPADILK